MSSVTNINFRGGESIGSIAHKNTPPVQCPECGRQVSFKGDTVELSGKKKRTGLKAFFAVAATALAAFGGLAWLGKSGKLNQLGEGKMKTIVEKLKINKAADKCSGWYDKALTWVKSLKLGKKGRKPTGGES